MHARKNNRYIITTFFLALIVFFSQLFFSGAVYGAEDYPFDRTNVLDDLETSEEFELINYPWDSSGVFKTPAIVNFVEWCYSPFTTGDFALYIYFYNPQNLKIDEDSFSNRIQMACAYDSYPITNESTPTDYDTYNLLFCSKSERANYEGLFYKFRVIDKKGADGKYIADRVYSGERRYDVSGVVLAQKNGTTKEYLVGGTYFFSGYASGYGPNANSENTLECTGFRAMETIELTVHNTNYRTESSSLGKYHENEVTSVYFSVPNYYFNKYGNLQKIKAEWYEYKTEPIFIVNNDRFNDLLPFVGVNIFESAIKPSYYYYNSANTIVQSIISYDILYNLNETLPVNKKMDTLYWLFPSNDRTVTAEQVENYVETYVSSFNKGVLPVKDGTISADLFIDTVDTGRTRGYNCKEFDANDDTFNLLSYDETHNGWEKFFQYFFNWSNAPTDSSLFNISPIEYKTIGDYINMSDPNVSDLLLINKNDVSDFRTFYNTAKENDETTVLFRFAQTDYYQEGLFEIDPNSAWVPTKGAVADVAQTTVFLDFKIIQLTFLNEKEEYKVIPVTQDPIDIYNGLSPTEQGPRNIGDLILAWLVFILSIALGFVAIIIVAKIVNLEAKIGNAIVKLIIVIITLAGVVVGFVFGIRYVIELITSLGGLW